MVNQMLLISVDLDLTSRLRYHGTDILHSLAAMKAHHQTKNSKQKNRREEEEMEEAE